MFAFIKGIVERKDLEYIVIEGGNIGYKVFMSKTSIQNVGEIGSNVKVHTYLKVKEDDVSIFGFTSIEELRMFELLISVSGIGAKSGINILSNIEPAKFALAVITDDVSTLKKLPGIGAKSAARIVLELKDKLKTQEAIDDLQNMNISSYIDNSDSVVQDAISALQVLGYNGREIEEAFTKFDKNGLSLEQLIKKSLTVIGGR